MEPSRPALGLTYGSRLDSGDAGITWCATYDSNVHEESRVVELLARIERGLADLCPLD